MAQWRSEQRIGELAIRRGSNLGIDFFYFMLFKAFQSAFEFGKEKSDGASVWVRLKLSNYFHCSMLISFNGKWEFPESVRHF